MPDLSDPSLFGLCAFGAGGLVAGLLGLLAGRLAGSRGEGPGLAPALACLLAVAACSAIAGRPGLAWPSLALAGLLLLFAASRSNRLASALQAALAWGRAPQRQWLALVVGCPLAAVLLALGARPADPAPPPPPIRPAPAGAAVTDRGRELAAAEVVAGSWSAEALEDAERRELGRRGLSGKAIRTAPPDWSYNCHGWVFTDGRFVLPDADVDLILRDNGYAQVRDAATGDVAVYREADGRVCHTGRVWAVGEGQSVLIESKWGWMGRYLHAPADTPCGGRPEYFRSPRPGRLLRGQVNGPSDAPGASGGADAARDAGRSSAQ